MPGGVGELGELHPLGVLGGLRAPPGQDGHPPPAPGGDLQAGEEHRVGESIFFRSTASIVIKMTMQFTYDQPLYIAIFFGVFD